MAGNPRLLLGTTKGLLVLERGAGGWRVAAEAHLGIGVSYAMQDPRSGMVWACLDHGHWGTKLERSRDSGDTWQPVSPPGYPADAELKPGVPATMRYLWVLTPGAPDDPDRLYLGTEPGGLFVTDDGGESFQLVESLWAHPSRIGQWFGGGRDQPGIHSVLLDPRDRRRVLLGISCAGVFESTDDGGSWSPRNRGLTATFLPDPAAEVGHDPHLLAMCASDPDVLWQQNHCGIFRSTDGARSWQEVSQPGGPAFFGFAIAADADDPETAWVVPAVADERRIAVGGALCVCRTEDGGKSWTALRSGLPQQGCYDVVYRHGLDVSGELVAFGSTTGNAYVSEDRGETWTCIGSNFPPINSVRFGV